MGRENNEGHHRSKKRKHSHESEVQDKRRGDKLPFGARTLSKDNMDNFRGVFAKYLKDKKDIDMDKISSSEAYGRFKSFVNKWYAASAVALIEGTTENCRQNTMILNFGSDLILNPNMKDGALMTGTRKRPPKDLGLEASIHVQKT